MKGHVVRPLLEVRRGELREYLERRNQPWREDASNLDTTRLRARLRHQVLPVIERELQPAVVAHLCRLAQMAREDEALLGGAGGRARREPWSGGRGIAWASAVRICWRLCRGRGGAGDAAANRPYASGWCAALVEELKGDRLRLTARHVDQVVRLAAESSSGQRTELPGIVAERSFEWIWFEGARDRESLRLIRARALQDHRVFLRRRAPRNRRNCDGCGARNRQVLQAESD